MPWTADDIPDQTGRTALVTGANSGIGLQAALQLAGRGAKVLCACRDPKRGAKALEQVGAAATGAAPELIELDLADLSSIKRAASEVAGRGAPLDMLINNAGVMAPPRRETADGFELQFGTNHLGHFALTAQLTEPLLAAEAPRVVNVSSIAHHAGKMDFDDLNWEDGYSRWPAYGRSKLSNLLFTHELDRRARAAGSNLISAACHPGYAATNLQTSGPGVGPLGIIAKPLMLVANAFLAQSDEMGALPTLYAATDPGTIGGDYIGPGGMREQRGHPVKVGSSKRAHDIDDAARLWQVSEELTGVEFGSLN